MLSPTTSRKTRAVSLRGILFFLGATLAICGITLGILGEIHSGILLRWTALVLLTVGVIRRPSFMLWTFLAMFIGLELGVDTPRFAIQLHFIGELFLRLIRMIVAPLLLATITKGIAGHSELRSIGRVALKSLIYFEIVTTIGLLFGAVAIDISGAGWGVAVQSSSPVPAHGTETWQQTIVNLVPENLALAVSQNQVLQVAIFSILFGTALALLPEAKRAPLMKVLQSLADAVFQLTASSCTSRRSRPGQRSPTRSEALGSPLCFLSAGWWRLFISR